MKNILTAFLLSMMMVLAGCKDRYELSINVPDVINQHETVSYSVTVESAQEQELTYSWFVDGKNISNLESGFTQFPLTGSHTISVKTVNANGVKAEDSVVVQVAPAEVLNEELLLTVKVADQQGIAISNAQVQINNTVVVTDDFGSAVFDGVPQTQVMVVNASKAGFIEQAYRYEFSSAEAEIELVVTLQEQADEVVFNSNEAVVINADSLNASISIPEAAFVDVNGNAVSGDVTLIMTPIDIRRTGSAFLGGGSALSAQGEEVSLIPLGMIDFVFTQNGQPVQLAAGKQAEIRMAVVDNVGADGRIFSAGDSIPMWWFDTSSGLWIEEGMGYVVESASSSTGLDLVATVSHFTTWNWDYYFGGDRASFTLHCTREGQALAANESCNVQLKGSSVNRNHVVGSSGLTVVNANPGVDLQVNAALVHGGNQMFRGNTSFTTISGHMDVTVDLQPVSTAMGYINCFVDDGVKKVASACSGNVSGSVSWYKYFISDSVAPVPVVYVPGETLTFNVDIQDIYQQRVVNTASVVGTLNLDFTVRLNSGLVTCFATLDGDDGEYFGCDGRVESDLNYQSTYFNAEGFTGSPKKGSFFYEDGSSYLTVWLSNAFVGSYYWHEEQSFGLMSAAQNADGRYDIDLNVAPAEVNAVYDIASSDLYEVKCLFESVALDNCYVDLYGSHYETRFSGLVSYNPRNAPSWMAGRVYLPDADVVEGYSSVQGSDDDEFQVLWSVSFEIDHEARLLTFTMEEGSILE